MDKITLVVFGLDRYAVNSYIEDVQELLDSTGAEYEGPSTLPQIKSGVGLKEIDSVPKEEWTADAPQWFEELTLDENDFARLRSFGKTESGDTFYLFGRLVVVKTGAATRKVVDLELPDNVCLHVETDTVNHHSGGSGTTYTYDPGQDHATDVDYGARDS